MRLDYLVKHFGGKLLQWFEPDKIDPTKANVRVQIAGAEDNSGGALGVNLKQAEIIQPVDIQAHYQQTIQTHNAVSVGAGLVSNGSWIDCNGFDNISVTFQSDASTSNTLTVYWSHDGATLQGAEVPIPNGTTNYRVANFPSKARYMKVILTNGDTASHIMSAWAYLKA